MKRKRGVEIPFPKRLNSLRADPETIQDKRIKDRYNHEEATRLHAAFMGGDREAGHTLVLSVVPLCLRIIKKFNPKLALRIGYNDVMHEVFIELITHLHTFDPTRGKITTWASWRMFSIYGRRLREIGKIVRVPDHYFRKHPNAKGVYSSYDWSAYPEQLYSGDIEPVDTLIRDEPDDRLTLLYEACRSARDKTCIDLRFQGLTLQQIGAKVGLTRERVRQVLEKVYGRAREQYDRVSQ